MVPLIWTQRQMPAAPQALTMRLSAAPNNHPPITAVPELTQLSTHFLRIDISYC
jgi:hypothetical protein